VSGHPLGVAGAGLASSLAVGVGVLLMILYFVRLEHYVGLEASKLLPRLASWRAILAIGLPAGGEFLMMFAIMTFVYVVIRPFGAPAQAGFGIGSRVMQAIFLPAMAVAFGVAPLVGQNLGAGRIERVRGAFRNAIWMSCGLMLLIMLGCLAWAPLLVRVFTQDAAAVQVGADYLRYLSWNFVASGLVMTCSGVLQGLGNTWPSLWSSASRIVTFMLPVVWLSVQPHFAITQIWSVSILSVTLQAVLIALLAARCLRRLPHRGA